jgi:hypothetical protein
MTTLERAAVFVAGLSLLAGCESSTRSGDGALPDGPTPSGDTSTPGDKTHPGDASSSSDTSTPSSDGPSSCKDGVQNGGETGVDCGGSCPIQDCCANGYADVGLGETGVDCGGTCPACAGNTYFVSNAGLDTNTGKLPTAAWKTIGKVNTSTFKAGDSILFRRGDTWREALVIGWSGSSTAYITFGAYGQGARPRILGSTRAEQWTAVSGATNVWKSATTLVKPLVGKASSIFFGEKSGKITWGRVQDIESTPTCGTSYSSLKQEHDWCWNSAIYVYSPADPGTRYAFIEVPQRKNAISTTSPPAQYISIDGLELMYTTMAGYDDGWPMDYAVRGLNIKNCHIGYIGIRGGSSAMGLQIWHSDMIVRNNEIHDSGRRNISYNVYLDKGRTKKNLVFENVLFEDNVLYHGFHTTGFDVSCEPGTGGTTFGDTFKNFTFKGNFIWDDPTDNPADNLNDFTSMGIYLWGESAIFTDFNVQNNILKHIKQKGLVIYSVQKARIFNNTFYGMNPNIGSDRPMVSVAGAYTDLKFNNNIVHGTVPKLSFEVRCVHFSDTGAGVSSMNNNLYFQEDPTQYLVYVSSKGYTAATWSTYLAAKPGWDTSSPAPGNPLFVDAAKNDFRLQPASPARNKGMNVGVPYLGAAPDIGALEYVE